MCQRLEAFFRFWKDIARHCTNRRTGIDYEVVRRYHYSKVLRHRGYKNEGTQHTDREDGIGRVYRANHPLCDVAVCQYLMAKNQEAWVSFKNTRMFGSKFKFLEGANIVGESCDFVVRPDGSAYFNVNGNSPPNLPYTGAAAIPTNEGPAYKTCARPSDLQFRNWYLAAPTQDDLYENLSNNELKRWLHDAKVAGASHLTVGGNNKVLAARVKAEHQSKYGDMAGDGGLFAAFLASRQGSGGEEKAGEGEGAYDLPTVDERLHNHTELQAALGQPALFATRVLCPDNHPDDGQPQDFPGRSCRARDTTDRPTSELRSYVSRHVMNGKTYQAASKLISASVEDLACSFFFAAKAIAMEGRGVALIAEIDLVAMERLKLPIFDASTPSQAEKHGLRGQFVHWAVSMREVMFSKVPEEALTGRVYTLNPNTPEGSRLISIAGNDRMTDASGKIEKFGRWGLWKEAWEVEFVVPGSWDDFAASTITRERDAVVAEQEREQAARDAAASTVAGGQAGAA